MTETSYPNPAVTQAQHERLMSRGSPSGVIGHPSDARLVYAPGSGTREIRVRANRQAIVEGYGWEADAEEVRSLTANSSGSTRTDLVVLRLDRATWQVRIAVKTGTPGSGAPTPTFQTGTSGVWELPLAEVTVASGASTIADSAVKVRHWYVGLDGQIRATATSRPAQDAGRSIWQHPEAEWWVSNGTRWLVAAGDSDTTLWTMSSGFTADLQHVHRRNGWAFADLTFRRSGAAMQGGTSYTVARLADGFRPPWTYQTNAQCPSAQVTLTVAVRGDGYIHVNPGVDVPANRTIVVNALAHPVA